MRYFTVDVDVWPDEPEDAFDEARRRLVEARGITRDWTLELLEQVMETMAKVAAGTRV